MPHIIDCEQGTQEWLLARAGIPTASEFEDIISTKRCGGKKAGYLNLMRRLAGERIIGEIAEPATSIAMQRGHDLEPEARNTYALITDEIPQTVGFILSDDRRKGFSPDAFIGNDGILEIKTKKPEFLIECIENDDFPEDHKAQCQGGLWIAEREWIDIMVYWQGLPPFIKRSYRDDAYIKRLSEELEIFTDRLDELVELISNYNTFKSQEAA